MKKTFCRAMYNSKKKKKAKNRILQRGGELFHAIIGPLRHLKQVSAFFDHVLEAMGFNEEYCEYMI